jgi:hypothetical protein
MIIRKDKRPPKFSEAQLQRVLDFCESCGVKIPTVDVQTQEGIKYRLSLRKLMKRYEYGGFVPLKPDWDGADVIFTIAARVFNEFWGVPEKDEHVLACMEEHHLANLFIATMLNRLYLDSTMEKHKYRVLYIACEPEQINALATAYRKAAKLEQYRVPLTKRIVKGRIRERNPRKRKLMEQLSQQYRVYR